MTDRIRFDSQWESYKSSTVSEELERALKKDCFTFYRIGAEHKANDLRTFLELLQTNLYNAALDNAAYRKLVGDVLAEMFKQV
jgi:hypothetical protein